jgi:fructan beta-fructosidase
MTDFPRPHYHFTPPRMWLNDPNGLVYLDGEYHLFYQYHPESTVWGPMHWGHAVSRDLLNWQHLPIALFPDEHGMIYSGSAVVDWKNTAGFGEEALVAIFTYNQDYRESQNLAYSTDKGRTWTKYSGNPVIPAPMPPSDCRDPKVCWHDDHWVMSLAAGDKILFFVSPDLKNWEQSGSFGGGYGCTDGVWETPDLFRLPVEGSGESRWVLTVGVGNGAPAGGTGTQYFIGEFDGRNFISENAKGTVLWTDFGADYYAPQSWNEEPHGRRLMIGWMNNWQYARLIPAGKWRGAFNLIRELSLKRTGQGIRLCQRPLPEAQQLRAAHQHWGEQIIDPDQNILSDVQGSSLEIIAELQFNDAIDSVGFRVRVGDREQTTVGYNPKERRLFVDRTRSGIVDFHEGFANIHTADLEPMHDRIRLHIFVDSSSVEVFANDGLATFAECIFPAESSSGLELFAEGSHIKLCSLDLFHLQPVTFQLGGS